MCRGVARHFARGVGHEAGVRGILAALREVPAQAGLEVGAAVALGVALVGAAAGQVIRSDELQHVGGESCRAGSRLLLRWPMANNLRSYCQNYSVAPHEVEVSE